MKSFHSPSLHTIRTLVVHYFGVLLRPPAIEMMIYIGRRLVFLLLQANVDSERDRPIWSSVNRVSLRPVHAFYLLSRSRDQLLIG